MLPNEILDKIFQYRNQDFRKFLSKIGKVNREYKEKFYLNESHVLIKICRYGPYKSNFFYYNWRYLKRRNNCIPPSICNPDIGYICDGQMKKY